MCGIYGILSMAGHLDGNLFGVPNDNQVLKHRGPDAHGHFLDNYIYLGHRRLSIIDLESGDQPIFNEDSTKCLIFNGEIYNYQEIRYQLIRKGHFFTTNSDSEVIIHAYEEWGEKCLESFRGMFAFAIWDMAERKLFLARDRLGIKPLFYAIYENTFYFASEMKAIIKYRDFPREIDFDGLASYFTLSYIPAPFTIFKRIGKLPPGHKLIVKGGEVSIKQYWDISFSPDYSKSEGYFIDGFMGRLEEAVKLRLISDVPVGAFLSGGVDSGTIVALMSKLSSEPVRTFCMGFGGNIGGYIDERRYARQVANIFKTIHLEHEILPDVRDIMEDIARSFDEPFADPSTIPSYYVCKTAREGVKVALSGLGGDEAFGGYERYLGFKLSFLYNRLPIFLKENIIKAIIDRLPERADGHYTINHLKRFVRSASLPQDIRYLSFSSMLGKPRKETLFSEPHKYRDNFLNCQELFLRHFNAPNALDPIDRIFYCDIKTYLPEDILACTDRMSMWHSLEVRVPFLDHKFLEFCATIPNEMKIRYWEKKHLLKKALKGLLPAEVLRHRKQGFVGPMSHWLSNDLNSYVREILSDKNLDKHGLLDKNTLNTILDEHFGRVEMNDKLIWALIQFQVWYNLYMEGST